MKRLFIFLSLLSCCAYAQQSADTPDADADTAPAAAAEPAVKPTLGMSILGNEEAPKSLVIVPWKRSRIGSAGDFQNTLNDAAVPVDRAVFMREIRFHALRSSSE